MAKDSKNPRRGRGMPSEPWLTSPLPQTPTPLECDVCGINGVCSITDNDHIHTTQHTLNLCLYLRRTWRVMHPEAMIRRYGVEVVHQWAERLFDMDDSGDSEHIRSRGGFAVWLIKELAAHAEATPSTNIQQTPHLSSVDSIDTRRAKRGGGGG